MAFEFPQDEPRWPMGGIGQVWIKSQMPGMILRPSIWLAGHLSRALCLTKELLHWLATAGTESKRRETDTNTCLLTTICFCLAWVVGASLCTLQT